MKTVAVGISGGIAAYKIPDLIRLLKKKKINVIPILSDSAKQFVTPLTLATLAESRCFSDQDFFNERIPHLSICKEADLFLIAPATANTLAKTCHGIADTLLTALYISFEGPVLFAPAMHSEMYLHPSTQKNIKTLKKRNNQFIGPSEGELACSDTGIGRLSDNQDIVDKIEAMFSTAPTLKGKRLLITGGGTREPIDNVRCITNYSTGKLAQKLASLAHHQGAQVTFISTTEASNPGYHKLIVAETATQLEQKLEEEHPYADVVIMAAAVSDFRPKREEKKIKRQSQISIELLGTPDLIRSLKKRPNCHYIGFCLTDQDLEKTAQKKLIEKQLDHIIANTPNAIGKDKRNITLISKSGYIQKKEGLSLTETASEILKLLKP